jgi:hypothetical protein
VREKERRNGVRPRDAEETHGEKEKEREREKERDAKESK